MTEQKVSSPQFLSLLFLSMVASVFMYISSPEVTVASMDSLLRPAVFAVLSIFAMIPVFLIRKKGYLPFNCKSGEKRGFYVGLSVFYTVIFFVDALITLGKFDLFTSSELFPGADMTFFIVGVALVCGFVAVWGIGALSRASTVFAFLVTVSTAFACVALLKEVDLLNLNPPFEKGAADFLNNGFTFAVQATELGAVLIFLPDISGNLKKNFILWSVLSALFFALFFFFIMTTLGVFADTKLFPVYVAFSLAEFGLFERMDALEIGIWILCIVSKLTFYLIAIVKCLNFTFPKVKKIRISLGCGVILAVIIAFISQNINAFGFVSSKPLTAALYGLSSVILPWSCYAYEELKNKKRKKG